MLQPSQCWQHRCCTRHGEVSTARRHPARPLPREWALLMPLCHQKGVSATHQQAQCCQSRVTQQSHCLQPACVAQRHASSHTLPTHTWLAAWYLMSAHPIPKTPVTSRHPAHVSTPPERGMPQAQMAVGPSATHHTVEFSNIHAHGPEPLLCR